MKRGEGRRGMGALALVIVLLIVAFIGVAAQGFSSRHLSGQAAAVLAGAQAQETARVAIDDAFRQLARIATNPADAAYAKLYGRLVASPAAAVDLSDLLVAAAVDPALAWKRAKHDALSPVGTVTVEKVRASAEKLAPLADALPGTARAGQASPDERVGLVALEAVVRVELAGRTTRRRLVEKRELKLAVAGPPRPFDQVGLYVSDISMITDAAKANAQRARILAMIDDAVEKLKAAAPGFAPEVVAELEAVHQGLPPADQRDRRLPVLPAGACTVSGMVGADVIGCAQLDLGARLEEDLRELATAHAALMAAIAGAGADGGRQVPVKLIAALDQFNRPALRTWKYQRMFKVLARGGAEHAQLLAPYEERLAPEWFADRTAATFAGDAPVLAEWANGRRALNGVIRIVSKDTVKLSGTRAGRAVLVVDAPEVELSNLTGAAPGDLVTVVASRGRVRIAGTVRACVIACGTARVELPEGSKLTGSLALTGAPRSHTLAGRLQRAPEAGAGVGLEAAKMRGVEGVYALALSPVPLFTEGDRR